MKWSHAVGDVKNLYDVFDLGEILLKLRRCFREARGLSRSRTIAVQMVGGKDVHWGAAIETSDKKKFVNATLNQIYRILQLDLRCVCKRGNITLIQRNGIAMGKPPSPGVAIMSLSQDEADFDRSQRTRWQRHNVSVECDRYMDDLEIRIGH